jgi:hypothetical protein
MWLLWGDFCFTMMEAVVPSIVPLRLKELEPALPDRRPGFYDPALPHLETTGRDRALRAARVVAGSGWDRAAATG